MGRLITRTSISSVDTTPNAFTFTDQTDVSVSSTIASAAITVAGINAPATISVTGGTYDINSSGSFTSSSGTVNNGDTVRARHTSSGSNSTAVNTVVTIGGVSDTFTSTTVASGSGTTIFSDDFSGYSTTSTGASTQSALLGGGWTEFDYAADNGRIENSPAVGIMSGTKCFAMSYTTSDEATDQLKVDLPAGFTSGTFEWDELRSSTFDFGPTKDVRFPSFRLSNGSATVDADLYAGIGTGSTSGNNDCDRAGVYIQGANFASQTPRTGGDANTVAEGSFVMTRNRVYHVKYTVTLNTPGSANGTFKVDITDTTNSSVTTIGSTACKLIPDGGEAQQIRRFQFGMSATNGGQAFSGTSRIYRTNLDIKQF